MFYIKSRDRETGGDERNPCLSKVDVNKHIRNTTMDSLNMHRITVAEIMASIPTSHINVQVVPSLVSVHVPAVSTTE